MSISNIETSLPAGTVLRQAQDGEQSRTMTRPTDYTLTVGYIDPYAPKGEGKGDVVRLLFLL